LFYKCKNLDFSSINFANGDLSNVEDMNGMFYGCEKLIEIKEFSKINNIKNVSFMFYDCINLKKLPEKLNFNTNNLTEAKGMFYDCKSLEKIPDMSNWNFNKVKNLSFMFFGCEKIEEIPNKLNDKYYTKDKDISYFDYNCKNIKGKIKFFREIEKEGCFGKCGGIMNKINKKIT
jgi:surface protein